MTTKIYPVILSSGSGTRPWSLLRAAMPKQLRPFRIKCIMVNPGTKLSPQMHHHRAEHGIAVSGVVMAVRNDDTIMLTKNQSSYIPLASKHRLENPGRVPLHLIEVQSSTYLGEDDIVRYEDRYQRNA